MGYVTFNLHTSYQLTSKSVPKKKEDLNEMLLVVELVPLKHLQCVSYLGRLHTMIAAINASPPIVASGGTMLCVESDPVT